MKVTINFGNEEQLDYFLSREADHVSLLAAPYHGVRINKAKMQFSSAFRLLLKNPTNEKILYAYKSSSPSSKIEYTPFPIWPFMENIESYHQKELVDWSAKEIEVIHRRMKKIEAYIDELRCYSQTDAQTELAHPLAICLIINKTNCERVKRLFLGLSNY